MEREVEEKQALDLKPALAHPINGLDQSLKDLVASVQE